MSRESKFERHVVERLEKEFPGCIVIKLLPDLHQGLPDRLVLFGSRWASLEVKASLTAPYQPNQEYYIDIMRRMSYSAMICPENEEEIFGALSYALKPYRASRVPKSKQ